MMITQPLPPCQRLDATCNYTFTSSYSNSLTYSPQTPQITLEIIKFNAFQPTRLTFLVQQLHNTTVENSMVYHI